MRLARCDAQPVPHNNADAVADAIAAWRRDGGTGRPWIIVESLYSMDGDRAPIAALAGIADAHGGFLVIAEAHATGVFGAHGGGLAAGIEGRENVTRSEAHTSELQSLMLISHAVFCLNKHNKSTNN